MSDYNPFVDEGEPSPPDDGPIEDGVAADDGQPTEQPTYEESKAYLDLDEDTANRYVRVKVDGEDLEVPLQEALQGYSRTADYTRKTQELATQRQQAEYALTVQRALQSQPAEALRLLARQYGVPFDSQSPPPQGREQPSNIYDDGDDDNPYADPLERRINEQQRVIDQMVQRDAQRQADNTLRAAVGGLQTKYSLDESTVREVVATALQHRLGPESFEMIYKNMAFDRAQEARAQAQAQRAQTDTQRQAAAERANQVVGNGRSANGAGGPAPGASDGPMSVSEAYELALREHGMG